MPARSSATAIPTKEWVIEENDGRGAWQREKPHYEFVCRNRAAHLNELIFLPLGLFRLDNLYPCRYFGGLIL